MVCVSIIIPVYNVSKYLPRLIDSVCNQSLKDIEPIFIDDCSTDNSLDILKEYAAKDGRIKIIHLEQNGGASAARNRGLELVEGEYIGFIDADDEIEPDYYEVLYKKAKETGAEIVKAERRVYEVDGRITYSHFNEVIRQKGDLYFDYEWTTAIYKTSLIHDNKITISEELINGEDTEFLNKVLLKKTTPLEFAEGVFYNYYRHEGSLNTTMLPLKQVASVVLSEKFQCRNFNESNLYDTNSEMYLDLFMLRVYAILGGALFQNKSFEAKQVCAQGIIDIYEICKDKNQFAQKFIYKSVLPYITNKQTEKFAKFLYGLEDFSQLNQKPASFFQKIFSLKNSGDKKYKLITVLGFQFRIQRRK